MLARALQRVVATTTTRSACGEYLSTAAGDAGNETRDLAKRVLFDLALLHTQEEFVQQFQHAMKPDGNGALFFEPAFAVTGKRSISLGDIREELVAAMASTQDKGSAIDK